jgi:hypothetical protein
MRHFMLKYVLLFSMHISRTLGRQWLLLPYELPSKQSSQRDFDVPKRRFTE